MGTRRKCWGLLLAIGTIASSACSDNEVTVCTTELRVSFPSARTTLRAGDTTTIRAQATTCGTRVVPMSWQYSVGDTAIAKIDSLSGLLTARASGTTSVRASGSNPIAVNLLPISVVP
ncbi:MAG TPA: hypothetical protein DGD08_01700 [Gemmatimonas aurantiaca]|nr:hypothetical protein [Gemmatimonas aurantiaca]HCT55907.1 hypothetical protein [Gemmatimonas aurantiaca]